MKTAWTAALAVATLLSTAPVAGAAGKLDTSKIEQLTGVKGEWNEKEGVFTARAPRTDLSVTAPA